MDNSPVFTLLKKMTLFPKQPLTVNSLSEGLGPYVCRVPSFSKPILQVSKARLQTANPMANVDCYEKQCDFPTLG